MANKKVLEIVVKDKATPAVKKIDKSLKNTGKQAVKTSKTASKSVNSLNDSLAVMPGPIQKIITGFKMLKVALISTGIGAIVVAAGALTGLFIAATAKGAEFSKQMSTLKAVSGATSSEMDAMSNSAKKLGSSTQFTANEVGELQTEFAKMGFTTKQILASTKATLDLAASMEVGLAEAAMLAGSTVNAFGLEAKDTQRVVDVLAASTSESALDFSSLTEAFKNVAPAAKATNRSVEETSALLGVLANNGIKGSRAGTQLSKAFVELNKKGLPLNDALDKIRNSSNGLKTAMELAGERGGKALLVLSDKRPQIEALTKSFENSAGAAKRMAETRLDNLAGDTTKLSSAWEGFLLSIEDGGGLFSSIARGIVQATTSLLNFITPTKELSDSLIDQQVELFGTETKLIELDKVINDTTTSENELKKAQKERKIIIEELQRNYPDYLGNIDSEKTSTEELQKAISKVNEELVNRIIIQQQQEEIEAAAAKLAESKIKRAKMEVEIAREIAELQAMAARQNIKINIDKTANLANQLVQANKESSKLDNSLKSLSLSARIKESIASFGVSIYNQATATIELNNVNELRNDLLKQLGISQEDYNKKIETNTLFGKDNTKVIVDGNGEKVKAIAKVIKKTRDLILLKQQELKDTQNREAKTRDEIALRNDDVKAIQAQIKELQSLSLNKLSLINKEIEAEKERQKKIISINESLNKKIETDAAKTSIEKIQLAKKRALEELNQLNATEKQKAATILFWDGKIEEAKEKTQQDELIKEEQQFQMLQKLQNTAQEQELLELAQQYDAKILLAEGNAELILALNEQQKTDEIAIEEKYNAEQVAITKKSQQQKADAFEQGAIMTMNALIAINDLTQAFAKEDEASQKKAFKINKAISIANATINTAVGVSKALSSSAPPMNFINAGIVLGSGVAAVKNIEKTTFDSSSFDTDPPSTSGGAGGGTGGGTSPSQAPNFNVVGQSGFNQVASALGTQQPVQAFVVAGNVTTAQQLANNTIQTATF